MNDEEEKNRFRAADLCCTFQPCRLRKPGICHTGYRICRYSGKKNSGSLFCSGRNSGVADAVTSASINPDSDPVHGYTRTVADWAAEYLGADMFSVQTVFDYPTEYQPTTDIALNEQRNNERPELETELENLDQYDTVVFVAPVWWSDIPMAMYTFFDSYDFSGKDLIVYITHYGSRFGRCVQTIRSLEPNATIYEGLAINQTQVAGARNDVIARLQELGY